MHVGKDRMFGGLQMNINIPWIIFYKRIYMTNEMMKTLIIIEIISLLYVLYIIQIKCLLLSVF